MVTGLVDCQADQMVTGLPGWQMVTNPNGYAARLTKWLLSCFGWQMGTGPNGYRLVSCQADQMVTGVPGLQIVTGPYGYRPDGLPR